MVSKTEIKKILSKELLNQLESELRFRSSLTEIGFPLRAIICVRLDLTSSPLFLPYSLVITPDPKHPLSIHKEIQSSKSIKRPVTEPQPNPLFHLVFFHITLRNSKSKN